VDEMVRITVLCARK